MIQEELAKEYQTMLADVLDNKNLVQHLETVTERINELTEVIAKETARGRPILGFEKLKNEYYFLKYQILERS